MTGRIKGMNGWAVGWRARDALDKERMKNG